MTPHLELGFGLIIGVLAAALIFLSFNTWRSKRSFKSSESAKTLSVAGRVLDEVDTLGVIIDDSLNIVFANQLAREYEGPGDLERHLADPRMHAIVFEVLTTSQPFVKEPINKNSVGALSLRIFRLDEFHVVAVADDVSVANRLHVMRRDFIANMSHELKTPIAAISLLTEAITKAASNPDTVQRFAEKLGKESRRLSVLSHDIIRLSEAQAPLVSSERESVDLADLVEHEVLAHSEIASQSDVTIVFKKRARKKADTVVLGREGSLRAAVANLIANAVAHSPEGGTVKVIVKGSGDGCSVTVSDEGTGIDPKYHARIFERFFRVDPARNRGRGGTGLGLSIVRNTARTHGGEIKVKSAVGEGASFELYIPASLTKATVKQKKRKEH